MKILHCSDLHLDSSLKTNLNAEKARIRRRELRDAFSNLVKRAEEIGAEAVMICGDLFDSENVLQSTADYIIDVIDEHSDVDFLYLRGNHDEKYKGGDGEDVFEQAYAKKRPSNLKLFSTTEWTYYHYGDTVICGTEGLSEEKYASLELDADVTNIVMLHGEFSTDKKADGEYIIDLKKLVGKNIDYLALGHIHSFSCGNISSEMGAEDGAWCYCGCLEGRGFDECGEKGCVTVETCSGKIDYSFEKMSIRRLEEVKVDISGLLSEREIERACEQALDGIPTGCMVSLVLTGSYTVDTYKSLDALKSKLLSDFFFGRVRDESRLKINIDDYKNDISLKGEFIRSVLESDMDRNKKEQVIMCGLLALNGEDMPT